MGLLDRFLKTGGTHAGADKGGAPKTKQDATCLIDDELELARAHFDRGNILLDQGDAQIALAAYAKAIAYKPDSAATHYNMGNAHRLLGQPDASIAAYQQAIAHKPDFVDAHVALGGALDDLGKHEDAVASYRRALELRPDYAEVQHNLGSTLQTLGRLDEAAASYRRALELKPAWVEAHGNLGNVLKDLRRLDDAIASYRQVLKLEPESAIGHQHLGVALHQLGQYKEAISCFRRSMEIRPDDVSTLNHLGNALQRVSQFEDAVAVYLRALAREPDHLDAHSNLGVALQELGRLDEAAASYRRALEITPDAADVHSNLGNVLADLGKLDESMVSTRRALEIDLDCIDAHDNLLFIHNYIADQPAALLLAEAQRYGELVTRQARPMTAWPNSPDPDRCLRVGLVSGDLRQHPVGNFLEGVLAALATQDATQLAVFAYPTRTCVDATSERIKGSCHGWHSVVGISDPQLVERIRADGIDILIDLSGHTAHNRLPLFAWKPSPVQASWLGYFATTGVPAIDYLIADSWTLPASEEVSFTEHIWRLPETRLCFTPPTVDVPVSPLPALNNQYITFGCFNNLSKLNDAVVSLWAQILNQVPGSRLFLKTRQLSEFSVKQGITERFSVHGIAANRLVLEGPSSRVVYLAAHQRIDIALDPFPYPGGTTTVEALWMGVPVLTLTGERFLSRQGVGLLMNAGLPEWVATDPDDYVARAVRHASDLQALSALRRQLRQQMLVSPIFDARRFAQHFEAALRGMWRKWCDQSSRAAF